MLFKLETRLRRLVWRASNPVYGVFISSTVLSFFAMKALASSYGPADTHRRRVEAGGTYAKRRFAEVNDSEQRAGAGGWGVVLGRRPRARARARSCACAPTRLLAAALLRARGSCARASLCARVQGASPPCAHRAPRGTALNMCCFSPPADPLYRLPEHSYGGHRSDGMSPQQHRGAGLQHH